MLRARHSQFLAVIVVIGLFPKVADAHTGPILDDLVIVAIAQFIVGPAFVILARIFEGRRLVYLVGFFLSVVCSWVFFFTGRLLGISVERFEMLTEGFSLSTSIRLSMIGFYLNFVGIPLATLAVVWVAYALRRKYHREK